MTHEMFVLPPNAVFAKGDQPMTTSLFVSESFSKPHKDVLQKVKSIDCSEEFAGRNFSPGYYRDQNGQMRPMYELTRDGFMFLVMGFTGAKAAKCKEAYIEAFNQMEKALLEQALVPPSSPKVELDAADFWKMKAELAELKLEKAEASKRQRKNFTEREQTMMRVMNARGKTPAQIAQEIGRNRSSVEGYLRRLGRAHN